MFSTFLSGYLFGSRVGGSFFFLFFSLFCLDIKLISLPLSYPKRGVCDSSSVGRALASQAKGHGFESRLSLKAIFKDIHYNDRCGVSKGIDRLIYRISIARDIGYLRCVIV